MNSEYFDDYMDMNMCPMCPFMDMNQGMYPCEMMNMNMIPVPMPYTMGNMMPVKEPKCMYNNMMQPYAQPMPMTQNPMMQQGQAMQYQPINPYELKIKTVKIEDIKD